MASCPITSWQIDGETMETMADFILGGVLKSQQMVTVAMKLKDACSLERKLCPTWTDFANKGLSSQSYGSSNSLAMYGWDNWTIKC